MRDEAEVYEALREVFSDVFLRDDIALTPTLTAKDVKGWDSFKQLEIIMATEQHFGMRFTSTEVDNLRCLGDLVAVVVKRSA